MTKTPLLLLLLACALAGCSAGGNNRPAVGADVASIRAVLADSHASLYHYRARAWWGRRVTFTLTVRIAADRRHARAVVQVAPASARGRRQLVLLARMRDRWRVVDTGSTTEGLRCAAAPATVMRELFGGCARHDIQEGPLIEGPRATRRAARAERLALEAYERRNLFGGHDRCVTYGIAISRVDPRWAEVSYRFHAPFTDCRVGNGVSLVERRGAAWQEMSEASSGFECDLAPPGVVRSLDGSCWLPDPPRR